MEDMMANKKQEGDYPTTSSGTSSVSADALGNKTDYNDATYWRNFFRRCREGRINLDVGPGERVGNKLVSTPPPALPATERPYCGFYGANND